MDHQIQRVLAAKNIFAEIIFRVSLVNSRLQMLKRPHVLAADAPDLVLARVTVSGRNGRTSTTDMHYLVGRPEGIEHFSEYHELGLFTRQEMRDALEQAGLDADYDDRGLIGRGLWLGRRSR